MDSSPKKQSMRIATTNLQQGGGGRFVELWTHILKTDADIHVLTEFRLGSRTAAFFKSEASKLGFTLVCQHEVENQNCVAILSKPEQEILNVGSFSNQRVLNLVSVQFNVLALYAPQPKNDRSFHKHFVNFVSQIEEPVVVIGDWNAGLHFIDEENASFTQHRAIASMYENGMVECWRKINGDDAREYSWFHKTSGRGFRIDQAFVNPQLSKNIENALYDHSTRRAGVTDHSTLVIDMSF